jgi:putative glutamine amidotransferase
VPNSPPSPRVGIYGRDDICPQEKRGCALWPAGYAAAVTEAGGTPVPLDDPPPDSPWDDALDGLDGVLLLGAEPASSWQAASQERLCTWCRERSLPLLGVDHGLHVLNTAFGGNLHLDLPRELPLALQHQHLPEKGDRHAITVVDGTRLARFYGEGEIVVNSEHRRAVCKVARDFLVSARALDGVVEGIEAEGDGWFAVGVQWHPASASASGLDIQLFRGFVEACREHQQAALLTPCRQAA